LHPAMAQQSSVAAHRAEINIFIFYALNFGPLPVVYPQLLAAGLRHPVKVSTRYGAGNFQKRSD
jgi:hypothetical protein